MYDTSPEDITSVNRLLGKDAMLHLLTEYYFYIRIAFHYQATLTKNLLSVSFVARAAHSRVIKKGSNLLGWGLQK